MLSFFLCSIPVNKIPHYDIAVISNPTVCDVGVFKRAVFGVRCSVFGVRCGDISSIATVYMQTVRYGKWLCDVFLAKYHVTYGRFPTFKKPYQDHVNRGTKNIPRYRNLGVLSTFLAVMLCSFYFQLFFGGVAV